ncbi:hypothetical protein Vadar_007287 [Vaccinium darrowii]|uniref:Uncharacterized protein n=1 Tax=Vaccinium darrowii TaxID=229202 RepID=A0ACB7ZIZ5_9ERIC|nr:hypothetical protein Vadar_007287 [Vaccinium darrowii]
MEPIVESIENEVSEEGEDENLDKMDQNEDEVHEEMNQNEEEVHEEMNQNEDSINIDDPSNWDKMDQNLRDILVVRGPAREDHDFNFPYDDNGSTKPRHFSSIHYFTLACMKMGRPELARKALDMAENRLSKDHWPEYYDSRNGKFIGKQARLYQTWSVAGFLTSKMLLENPEMASLLFWDEDSELLEFESFPSILSVDSLIGI